jgi:predicted porin
MKKSLLALAVLGAFAGAASAQSSVTIYGSLDQAVARGNGGTAGNNGGSAGNPSLTNNGKAWFVQQSNSSRLGFRGNEDLGGGLSAQFQIEHRFTPDDGNANAVFWAGRSYVQLSSASAGRIYLGRDYTPAFWPAVKSDPFGWDGVGQLGTLQWAGYLTPPNPNGGVRTSNTVGYKSPSFGGVTVQVAEGLSETTGVGRNNGLNIEYGAGPIYAGFGYEKISKGNAVFNNNQLWNFALHYDLGLAKIMGYYARAKVFPAVNGHAGTALETNKVFDIGVLAPIGPGTLKAAWLRLDPQGSNATGTSNNTTKYAIGYDYPFSKRTNVYADVGVTRGGVLNAVSVARGLRENSSNTTYAFGLKHTF